MYSGTVLVVGALESTWTGQSTPRAVRVIQAHTNQGTFVYSSKDSWKVKMRAGRLTVELAFSLEGEFLSALAGLRHKRTSGPPADHGCSVLEPLGQSSAQRGAETEGGGLANSVWSVFRALYLL